MLWPRSGGGLLGWAEVEARQDLIARKCETLGTPIHQQKVVTRCVELSRRA